VNVTYQSNGAAHTIKGKEIIISGGSINTPKLLLLSGIGPADQLSRLGISVVADIPDVGANLRDHAFSIVELLVTHNVLTLWQWYENATEEVLAQEQYAANASGPLGWNNGFVYAAFRLPDSVWDGVNGTHYTSLPSDRPHALIEFSTVPFISDNASAITAWASLVQPQASGHVALQSSDYRDDPLIYTNYYGSPADKAAIIYSYKKLRAVLGQDEVKQLTVEEFYPGTTVTTDEEIWAAIQGQTFSFRHPVGTVAIGKALNSNWRLKGLKGIRVVDSSTFPYPTTCHPQAVVYALANRAAKDILKADERKQRTKRWPPIDTSPLLESQE
jgi:choline dehydrogenase-like flavoprotein